MHGNQPSTGRDKSDWIIVDHLFEAGELRGKQKLNMQYLTKYTQKRVSCSIIIAGHLV